MCVGSKATVCYTPRNTKSHLRVRTRPRSASTPPFLNPPKGLVTVGTTCCPLTGHFLQCQNAECHWKRCTPAFWQTSEGSCSTMAEAHTCLCLASRPHLLPRRTEKDRKERAGRGGKSKSILSEFPQGLRGLWLPACSVFLQASQNTCETHRHTHKWFFSVLRMSLKEKKAWLHNRLMEWQLQKSSDLDAGCKYHLCLKDRQPFISNSLLSFFQKNMFFSYRYTLQQGQVMQATKPYNGCMMFHRWGHEILACSFSPAHNALIKSNGSIHCLCPIHPNPDPL